MEYLLENKDEQQRIIQQLRPDAKEVTPLSSGEMNDMILVDDAEIFRFPRTTESCQRLAYESRVLDALKSSLHVPIPSLIAYDSTQNFSVLSYITGDTLTHKDIQAFSTEQKDQLATTLAQFMLELNKALSVNTLLGWTNELMPGAESWDSYYERIAHMAEHNEFHAQYVQQYEKVISLRARTAEVAQIAIHGDLHAGNMLFKDTTLNGIIDFGDCETGTIYNELRPLFNSFGSEFIQKTVSELGGALGDVDVELVREMAIMHELSVLARSSSTELHSSRANLARELLEEWLEPNGRIKAVIFDCFGVLTSEQWIPFRRKHFHGDDARHFAQRMMNALVTGKIAPREFISTIAEEGNVDEEDVLESLSGSQPDKALFSWIAEHKSSYKISMLSNAGVDMLDSLFTKNQLALFDDTVLSFEVGLAKPDPAIFHLAAERLGLKPEECLFVDDKASFCEAARRVGMRSVQYQDYEQFATAIDTMQS